MNRTLKDRVVVITGASSGIGRATAMEFARHGASTVLAAREPSGLNDVARACQQLGGHAIVIPTDVTDPTAVQSLARQAFDHFGRVDVWVNNAAITGFGRFQDMPSAVFRKIMETNFFGYVNGARAVLPLFREQGGGVLINVASIAGKFGAPYLSAYISSKFAIIGFSESLRNEVADDNIDVCLVLPGSIDTPLFQHAANYTGRAVKPMKPVYSPMLVARKIVNCARHPRREVYAGKGSLPLVLSHSLSLPLFDRIIQRQVDRDHFQNRPAAISEGNVFDPRFQMSAVTGGWIDRRRTPTAKWMLPLAGMALAGAAALALARRTPPCRSMNQQRPPQSEPVRRVRPAETLAQIHPGT